MGKIFDELLVNHQIHQNSSKITLYNILQPYNRSGVDKNDPSFVYVDAHVLATPVLVDFNGDGVTSELVVPVSYYFDPYHYR